MESVNEGCYLWGTLLNVRGDAGPERRPSCRSSPGTPTSAVGELEAFLAFWEWFPSCGARRHGEGSCSAPTATSQAAENGQLRRLAALCGLEEDVDEFIRSEDWVDLLPIVRDQLITGLPYGLKTVAPLTGFSWREEDVGGVLAMVRYFEATADPDSLCAPRRAVDPRVQRGRRPPRRAPGVAGPVREPASFHRGRGTGLSADSR